MAPACVLDVTLIPDGFREHVFDSGPVQNPKRFRIFLVT